jgi:hypothetical protein
VAVFENYLESDGQIQSMKKLITCLLAVLGMTSACGQKNYEDVDVTGFAELIADSSVVILDVRT